MKYIFLFANIVAILPILYGIAFWLFSTKEATQIVENDLDSKTSIFIEGPPVLVSLILLVSGSVYLIGLVVFLFGPCNTQP